MEMRHSIDVGLSNLGRPLSPREIVARVKSPSNLPPSFYHLFHRSFAVVSPFVSLSSPCLRANCVNVHFLGSDDSSEEENLSGEHEEDEEESESEGEDAGAEEGEDPTAAPEEDIDPVILLSDRYLTTLCKHHDRKADLSKLHLSVLPKGLVPLDASDTSPPSTSPTTNSLRYPSTLASSRTLKN